MVRLHAGQPDVDAALVRRLVAACFPEWADDPVEPVDSVGTSNALYRLGDDLVVRLPLTDGAVAQVGKERVWLPRLAPSLPLAVPVPVAHGTPAHGYPHPWAVYRWLPGSDAARTPPDDARAAARDLAAFVAALQAVDASHGPPPGDHNFWRGVPLARRDARVRECVAQLADLYDPGALTVAWEAALGAPEWAGPPVWLHGDLQGGNLLVRDGRLSAVVDFGGLGAGDPACDVMTAWTFLPAHARDEFRTALAPDDATWARARGWALSVGVIALPYYRHTSAGAVRIARQAIDAVLADPG